MTHKPRVILVDVDDTRRETIDHYLSARYEVHSFPLARHALKALPGIGPAAVVAHAYQPGGSAAGLCASARSLLADSGCVTLVYGRSRRPYRAPRGAPQPGRSCDVDLRLDRRVDVVDVDKALALALARHQPTAAPTPPPAGGTGSFQVVTAARSAPRRGLWRRFRDPDRIIDRLPSRPDVSWRQILHARVTLHNIGVALNKHVTPLVDRLPRDRRPTFDELFRARASLYNVSVILGVGPGSSAPRPTAN